MKGLARNADSVLSCQVLKGPEFNYTIMNLSGGQSRLY